MIKKYIMLGAGGHASVCRDVAKISGFSEAGFVLQSESQISNARSESCFLGTDDWLCKKLENRPYLINGIGGGAKSKVRSIIFNKYYSLGFKFLSLIHPSAQISSNVTLGDGVQIMAGAIIQPNCSVEANSIINTGASIDHDCIIKKDAHIAPGAVLCGNVEVGQGAFVGSACCITPGLFIGDGATVGAGITVLADVIAGGTFTG